MKKIKEEEYKIKSGKYKGYSVCWTDGGQIFSRAGFYLMNYTPNGDVKDILYLEEALNQNNEKY